MMVASMPPIDEKAKRVNNVEDPQLLVIYGDNPVVEPLADWPGVAADCAEQRWFLTTSLCSSLSSQRQEVRRDASRSFSFSCIAGINEPGLIESGL